MNSAYGGVGEKNLQIIENFLYLIFKSVIFFIKKLAKV